METPLCLSRASSCDLHEPDIGAYLPSYTVIDEHVGEVDGLYTEAELDQLDAELGMQPRSKKARRRSSGRAKSSELTADLKKKLGEANMMYTMDNNLTGAAQVLLEIIRSAPQYPEPYNTLGVVYEELGQKRQALQVFILAAHFTPRDVDQWRRLANLAVDLGDTDQALHCLSRIIRMSPSDTDALYHRSIIYKDRGDLKRSMDGLARVVAKSPNTARYLQAYCPMLFEQGKAHVAQDLLEQYMQEARRRLGVLAPDDDDGRRRVWDLTLINMLCELYMQQRQFDDAKALLTETVSRRLSVALAPELSIRFGLCHLCSGEDLSDADRHRYESMADQIFDLDPGEFAAFYLEVGDLYLSIDLPDKALHILTCLEDLPTYSNADLWFRLARCYKDLPDSHEDAIRHCERILQDMPNDADSRLLLSEVYRAEGDTDQAIAVLQSDGVVTSTAARPDWRRAELPIDTAALSLLFQHCQLCLSEGKYADIVRHAFDKVSEAIRAVVMRRRRPRRPDGDAVPGTTCRIRSMPSIMIEGGEFLQTAMIVCRALIAVERFDQASNIVRQLLRFEWPSELNAQIRDFRCMAVDLFCHRGEYDRAYVQITTAILDMPKAASDSYLMYLLGVILHKLNYPERTRRFLERVINKHPECVSLRVALGHYAIMKHFFTGACREYLRALSMAPLPVNPSIVLYAAIGLLHRSQSPSVPNRNFSLLRAFELFFVYVKKLRRAPHALYNLARAFHSVSINHLAVRYYKEAIDAVMKNGRRLPSSNIDPSPDFLFSLSLATPAASEANIVRNVAFNLSLIYRQSGSTELARRVLVQHIEF